jgi:maltose alpha-D-glucosyltransferase/alpha-amylase
MSKDEPGPGGRGHAEHGPLAPATGAATGPLMSSGGTSDPHWYKHAVFYEVLARGFFDSNGDGTGDLAGLVQKLDYLQWLGIDCVWLLPMYESPLRDGGYDISDYFKILPEFGRTADFVELLDEAHRRGIRVITDLVMNHTSDQHPWFKASREDPDGPYGDFYVWSDTDDRYDEARIIFVDTETSNWTYDEVRGQYYWHRFFSHQPDLNFENPAVQEAILEVLRYWLDLGIDGFRLDAVPYLYEREGTNCENLKETHEFLKRVRAEVDRLYPDRVLLSEANQWPSDVVDYFGDFESGGDECHMNFHFPLMPRMFMAVRQEQRFPISEILAQTPPIPRNCQWAIFLRNHDELTLEMVTDEERDYMYSEYAKEPRMRANVGIRRRLAPLLDNDRNQIELFTALLLSLPGSPVLYYGDEIGMGDNIWLGDRDAVRTPMQWSSDRNAGFSKGDPARLYLPLIMDPVYGYQALNVESQRDNPGSLLHWTRRMIQIRKRHPVFGTGAFTELNATNPSVLAFIREHGDDRMLCVNNLSRYPQPVELDLGRYAGVAPVECVGGVRFPEIGELPYLLTLPGHGFYWFQLPATADRESTGTNRDGVPSYGLPEAGARVHATFEASPVSAAAARTHATEHPVSTTSSIPAGFSPAFGDGARTPSRGSAVHASGPSGPAAERTGRGGGEKGNGSL